MRCEESGHLRFKLTVVWFDARRFLHLPPMAYNLFNVSAAS